MKKTPTILTITLLIGLLVCSAGGALAVPTLQLYIPGSTYDTKTETWVYQGYDYWLYVVGADSRYATVIEDVYLAAAVKGDEGTITIKREDGTVLTSSLQTGTPVKGDGKLLPEHGIYPSDFYEFYLGSLKLTTPGIPDYTQGYDPNNPVSTNNWGTTLKLLVDVDGYDWVHFDLYDHIEGKNHASYVFAPFSHDAEDGPAPVPEPATMLLLGSGLIGLAGLRKRLSKR